MPGLRGSVGRHAANMQPDVIEVQRLLNTHINAPSSAGALAVDGRVGPATVEAILAFQTRIMGMAAPDGRVDPNGRTHLALMGGGGGSSSSSAHNPETTATGRFDYTPGVQGVLADIAAPYIGATEARGNRMGTDPRMREIFEADRLMNGDRTDGYAWCCSFVSMCVQKLIRQTPALSHVGPPHTAGVSYFRTQWAPAQNCLIFPPNNPANRPARGDVAVYTFSHIGIVTAANETGISTIEGNTNAAGSREGTTVMRKERANGLVRCFIRLPLLASSLVGLGAGAIIGSGAET